MNKMFLHTKKYDWKLSKLRTTVQLITDSLFYSKKNRQPIGQTFINWFTQNLAQFSIAEFYGMK